MHKLIGKVSLVKPIIERLQINEIIEDVMKDSPHREKVSNGLASEVLVMNRLTAPMPMYHVEEWVDNETVVGDVLGVVPGSMNDDRIINLFDDLHAHIPEAWNKVISKAITEYDLPVDLLYNDLTSTYFEGAYTESELVKFGYSRDQKPDKKQANLGIDSNVVGIPVVYSIFSGETADKATVIGNMEKVMTTLKETSKSSTRPMIVGDRAMLDSKIIAAYHKRDDMDFLGTLKLTNAMKSLIKSIPDKDYKLLDTKKFHGLYEGYETEFTFKHEGKGFTDKVLIVRSEQKFRTDQNQRRRVIEKFTDELDELRSKLNGRMYKQVEAVEDRIESLKEKHRGSKYVKTEVVTNSEGKAELNYSIYEEQIADESLLDGKYMMATNRKEMTPEEMLGDYKVRDISEKDFSIVKGTLAVRPIFIHKDERIETLVFFSILALLVYSILKMLLIEKEIELSITRVFYGFKSLSVACCDFNDGSQIRTVSDLSGVQMNILDRLGFPYPEDYINFVG